MILVNSLLLLLSLHAVVSQYNDNLLTPTVYEPPAHQPPSPSSLSAEPYNDDEVLATPKLRAPPTPKWVEKVNNKVQPEEDASGSGLGVDGSGSSTIEQSGDHGGNVESSGLGNQTDDGSSGEASGAEAEISAMKDLDALNILMGTMMDKAIEQGRFCASDVMFVVDSTSSVKGIFEAYKRFIIKVIEGLHITPEGDHVGAIIYSSEKKQRLKIELGQYDSALPLVNAINDLPFFSGITATGAALNFTADHIKNRRSNKKLYFVVLTDGYSYDLIEPGARKLQAVPNSTIFAVSLGDSYLPSELEMITAKKENVYHGDSAYGPITALMSGCGVLKKHEARYVVETATVRYIPTATDSQGNHLIPTGTVNKYGMTRFNDKATDAQIREAIKLSMDDPNFIGLTTQVPYRTTDCVYDIGIIFDASGSLISSFQRQLELATQLLQQLPIDKNQTQVAIIQFAGKTKTKILSNFGDANTKQQLQKIIKFATFFSGTTFTNHALLKMAEVFEHKPKRNAVPVLLIFTDGYSGEDITSGVTLLKSMGITIYTVGVNADGINLNVNELEYMATDAEHYYEDKDFSYLLNRFPSQAYCPKS